MTGLAIAEILRLLLWVAMLGAGLLAGVFFAFSTFVMAALGRIAPEAGIAAMQSINRVILGSAFMPVFFVTPLAAALLLVAAILRWPAPGSLAVAAGALLVLLAMFGSTVVANVPLNQRLDAVAPGTAEAEAMWRDYLRRWTAWNHLRTVAPLIACGLFAWALPRFP